MKPVNFKQHEVVATLEGRKTQFRRVVKVQPSKSDYKLCRLLDTTQSDARKNIDKYCWGKDNNHILETDDKFFSNPFGEVGDKLWVRETFIRGVVRNDGDYEHPQEDDISQSQDDLDGIIPLEVALKNGWLDGLDKDDMPLMTPSIHMPQWVSRITLEITDIRVERLNEIQISDIWDEGIIPRKRTGMFAQEEINEFACEDFAKLWDSIYSKRGLCWDKNPWVWVLEFKVVEEVK